MKAGQPGNGYPQVILKKGREESLLRLHPRVFSGAIQSLSSRPESGTIVEVFSSSGVYLGTGHYENNSLAVKIFNFDRRLVNADLWEQKIENAYTL